MRPNGIYPAKRGVDTGREPFIAPTGEAVWLDAPAAIYRIRSSREDRAPSYPDDPSARDLVGGADSRTHPQCPAVLFSDRLASRSDKGFPPRIYPALRGVDTIGPHSSSVVRPL
jgi:hypothetical protein